jgi:TatD-related deoxyribonuclease
MDKLPVYDDHFHMSPSGRNVDALLEFKAAGGTGITLVTLPYAEIPITKGKDFARSYEITYDLAKKARAVTELEINIAVGPYPVLIIPLAEHYGLEVAEEMLVEGMEDAAKDVADGKACAIGEIGRPHFETDQRYIDASNRILMRGMELAKENDVPVIIHCESGSTETNRSLAAIAKKVGLDPGLVVKHSSPPFVTDDETYGIMPSIPASRSNIKEALSKGTTRFMIETDYIDDPEKPMAIMAPATVPNKVRQMLGSGMADEEAVRRICKDIPDSLYHR